MSDITASGIYATNLNNAENSYNTIRSRVSDLRKKSRLLNLLNSLVLWLFSLSILAGLWLVFIGIIRPPIILRGSIMILLLLAMLFLLYYLFIRSIAKKLSIEKIAFRIEQLFPELQDRLISSLQLWDDMPLNKYGYSENLVRMVIEEARAILERLELSKVLSNDKNSLKRSAILLLAGLLPVVILILFVPSVLDYSAHAFMNPFEQENQSVNFEIIQVQPGNITIQSGNDIEIIAEVNGDAPENADLHIKYVNTEWQTMPISLHGSSLLGNKNYSTKLVNIRQSMEYYLSALDAESPKYKITVAQKPIISNLQIQLYYPKYLDIPPQALSVNVGDISAPVGTRVAIGLESDKDIASAFIVFGNTENQQESREDKIRMSIMKSTSLNGSFMVKKSGTYHISVLDNDGLSNSEPIKYSINAIKDNPPSIKIISPAQNITLDNKMMIQLHAEIQDDHGIANTKLVYQVEGQENKSVVMLGSFPQQQSAVSIKYLWDLMPIQLFPEDVISYYLEAVDFDNVSGPNVGRSSIYTARFPSLYEIYKQTETEQDSQKSEMEDILKDQDDVKKAVDNIIKELKSKDNMEWTEKKELEKVVDLQKKIDEKMNSVAQQIDKTVKKMEENPLISSDLVKKVQELKDLINELATDDMKQIMKKLSESIDKVNLSEQQKSLMLANMKQEELMEKLDRAINLFKNMQIQQKLEVAANVAKELERQQADTLNKTEQLANENPKDIELRSNELSSREDRIKTQLEELQNDIDKLVNEAKDSNPAISKMLEYANNKATQSRIPEQLQKASEQLKCCNASSSIPHQKQALSNLSKFQSDLNDVKESAKGMDSSEITNALRDAVRKSLYISKKHEEITKSASNIKGNIESILPKEKELMDSLASDQLLLAENVKKVANQLRGLSKKNISIDTELVWGLERAGDAMQRSSKAMEDKMPALAQPIQRNSLAMLNRSIEQMLESIDKINSQATPMMSMDDYMEQLRQLAEQQSQLNKSTQNAESQMRRQGMTPSLQDLLEQLAIEQSLIKEASERLAGKLDQQAQSMGSLEEIAKEMQEVEKTMRDGYVDKETIDKQRRILTRLLEYEKSMKKQDFDQKREAKAGRDYLTEKPSNELPPDAKKITKQLDTMFTPSPKEQWPMQYRELIKQYYKSLSNMIKTNE